MAQANPTEGPIEKELEVALRNMKKDSHRYGGALVLKELARNAPTLFYLHVSEFFDCVGEGLKDPNIAVRECTLEALRCALSLVSHREHNHRHQWYHAIYQDAFEGLMAKSVTPAVVHGSLLTMGTGAILAELLVATDWMEPRYRVLCEKVLQFKDNKDKMVVNTVITLLPILANFSPQQFNELLLKDAVAWLLTILEKKGDISKPEAFLALGQIAKASGKQPMKPYVAAAMERVGESLDPKKQSSSQALQCLGLLAEAMGSDILVTVSTVELLSKMFSSGLTSSLIDCLRQLSGKVNALLPRIQEALMDEISWILAGKAFANFQQNDAVSLKKSVALAGAMRPVLPMRYTYPDKDKPTQLALETLATFNLQVNVYNVAEFIREIVVSFLDDDEPDIRQAAARTCTSIMGRAEQTDRKMAPMVNEVVEKLLIVGISDAEPKIRETVFSFLKHGFDQYLIRELAITIIGRLTVTDPGNVMPSLRKTLIQLVTGLELSNNRTKEESARLLGSLIRSSHHLIKPYVGPILDTLLLELLHSSTRNPAVGSHVFATIGELARVGRETVVPHL
ncbi:FRAP subfamily protein kinase, partial [Acanthamoeba castellanii str. Neff]